MRHRDFRYFFAGRLTSLLGNAMAPVALAFAVLDAAGSTTDLGIVLAAHMVPLLAFLLIGGAVSDRFSRRNVLVVANLGSGLTQGAVAAVLLTGNYHLGLVAGLEFANGAIAAFTTPALRGIVPQLVEPGDLQKANSLLGSTRNATRILGPTVSGLLVGFFSGGVAIAFDAATFLIAAAFLARLRDQAKVQAPPSTVFADIREGWVEFRRIRWVRNVAISFCFINLVQTGSWQILGPTLTRESGGEEVWGFVLSARGLGLLIMSMVMYRLFVVYLLRLGLMLTVLGALPLIALGLQFDAPWLIVIAFLAGLGVSVTDIAWDTSLQEHVPPRVLSRVSSYDDLLSYIAIPVGQLLVGPLANTFGGRQVALAAGVLYAVAAFAPLVSRSVRQLPHRPAV